MPGRSRKRGRHGAPPPAREAQSTAAPARTERAQPAAAPERAPAPQGRPLPSHLPPPRESRSEARNAEIRATLAPYAPGERPPVVLISTALSAALALANLVSWLAGLKVSGHHPAALGIFLFSAVLLACAGGLWQMRSGAVLGFMCLMAIIAVLFTLLLIEASNLLGVVVALAVIVVSGYLFFKLVRVLSRLQVPREH
ncbi:MAG TPA: hypothetical protein VMF07_07675 [Solirubrobacteraceae bacterium]|nr:hypothetical protein [Solirubrobacteraceae bacterium]